MSDDAAKHTHAMDQFKGAVVELAAVLADYRKNLEAEGFSPQEAFTLCLHMQSAVFVGQKK